MLGCRIDRCCACVLVVALAACGSVREVEEDAAADAWTSSCQTEQLVTTVQTAAPGYGDRCIHGRWTLEALNGATTPDAPNGPGHSASVTPEPITIGSNPLDPSSTFAVHVSGNGQQNNPPTYSYAQLFAPLNTASESQVGTVDATAFTGVQFYAIIQTGGMTARLSVGDLYTDPSGGMCTTTPGATTCYDHPTMTLDLSTTWTKYQVPFVMLTQRGFGNISPLGAAFPKDALVFVRWDVDLPATAPAAAWDLWVDDVTFY